MQFRTTQETLAKNSQWRGGVQGGSRQLMDWYTENKLHLNVNKLKELIVDFRKLSVDQKPSSINGTALDRADIFKYLRFHLSWTLHMSMSSDPVHSNHHLFMLLNLTDFNKLLSHSQADWELLLSQSCYVTCSLSHWPLNLTHTLYLNCCNAEMCIIQEDFYSLVPSVTRIDSGSTGSLNEWIT